MTPFTFSLGVITVSFEQIDKLLIYIISHLVDSVSKNINMN